ncbi:hypothetical protein ACX93W_11860 [Paenibacillus sp. CAU 1782]
MIREELNLDFSFSYIAIVALGALSLAVSQENLKNPLPKDWLINSNDANQISQNLIIQLTNHSLSIVRLSESGFDSSARLLMKPLIELITLTLVVTSNKEQMQVYANGINEDVANNVWYKNFRFEHTNKKLAQIESTLGLPNGLIDDFKMMRIESYKFYSDMSHNAYYSCVLGSFAFPFDEVSNCELTLFGKYSRTSIRTISKLNEHLYYFILAVVAIIHKLHGFKAPPNNVMWRMAFALRQSVINSYLHMCKITDEN